MDLWIPSQPGLQQVPGHSGLHSETLSKENKGTKGRKGLLQAFFVLWGPPLSSQINTHMAADSFLRSLALACF